MKNIQFDFGLLMIDDIIYTEDIVIDAGVVKPRLKDKNAVLTGHRPLMITENIPWECKTLIIGTGVYEAMPIDKEVYEEAKIRNVNILNMPTQEAVEKFHLKDTNFVLHLTC